MVHEGDGTFRREVEYQVPLERAHQTDHGQDFRVQGRGPCAVLFRMYPDTGKSDLLKDLFRGGYEGCRYLLFHETSIVRPPWDVNLLGPGSLYKTLILSIITLRLCGMAYVLRRHARLISISP